MVRYTQLPTVILILTQVEDDITSAQVEDDIKRTEYRFKTIIVIYSLSIRFSTIKHGVYIDKQYLIKS